MSIITCIIFVDVRYYYVVKLLEVGATVGCELSAFFINF